MNSKNYCVMCWDEIDLSLTTSNNGLKMLLADNQEQARKCMGGIGAGVSPKAQDLLT